jgi:transposase-like protein
MDDLFNPVYQNEKAARKHLEALRWPDGPVCPHCGTVDEATKLKGESTRPGVWKCRACEKPFSITVGTVFERSHIPLHKWLFAVHALSSSKKGMSAHQLHRTIGVTYKTAWFMFHRIREAMTDPKFTGPLGTGGGTVEADESYIGGKMENKHAKDRKKPDAMRKEPVVALVERNGSVRSFHVAKVNARTLRPILRMHVSQTANLNTDNATYYKLTRRDFASHKTINHDAGEYVRGDVHTNTVEGYFSILKRGIYGVYQHVSEAHLKRYLAEFDFRYNNRSALGVEDAERSERVLKGIEGKRLTYRRTA